LPGNVLDDSLRHLILIRREASFHLKKLQQERESQSADTALVHQQHKFAGAKRPVLDQFFLSPDLFHWALPQPKPRQSPQTS
jgi:hypothetical protein